MKKLSRRALGTLLFTLLAMTASLTAVAVPANAAYSPQVVCNRSTVHRGSSVGCVIHHFPAHHHGKVTVTAKFRKTIHHHHHKPTHKWVRKTRTVGNFFTSRHGGRIVSFIVPANIHKGHHTFHFTVGHVSRGVKIRTV
jgi:hypothetical protein